MGPLETGDSKLLEKVRKNMITTVSGLKGGSYEEKLAEIGKETMAARRQKLDLSVTE